MCHLTHRAELQFPDHGKNQSLLLKKFDLMMPATHIFLLQFSALQICATGGGGYNHNILVR